MWFLESVYDVTECCGDVCFLFSECSCEKIASPKCGLVRYIQSISLSNRTLLERHHVSAELH